MKSFIRSCAYFMFNFKHRFMSDHLRIQHGAKATRRSRFEGYNKLSPNSFFDGELGYASYIGENSIVSGRIGRYCSIAGNVHFISNTHPVTCFVSSSPCFYSLLKQSGFTYVDKQLFDESPKVENEEYSFVVGNDVYIGYGATIIGPCVIGDGAVIAANATVTGDVAPYSIVGGTPAKEIKKRFADQDVDFLMNFKWWEKDSGWLKKHASAFTSLDEFRNSIADEYM